MKKKKIFIEIAIPRHIKKRAMQKTSGWKDLPVKWTKEENLHLTVAFLGYVDEEVLPEICQKVREAVEKIEPFEIGFDRIEMSPVEDPRLIQLSGSPSEDLRILNEEVERLLGMMPPKHKQFNPHITLGRIRKQKWKELEQKPIVGGKLEAVMPVESVSVMESVGDGAEYVSVEECELAQ